jgi:predicted permease
MGSRTITFLIFITFSLLCLALGYAARRKNWVDEHLSRPLHHFTLTWLWSPVSLLAFWGLDLTGDNGRQVTILMLAQPVLMIVGGAAMVPIMRAIHATRKAEGVMVLAGALSNHGFTLGSFLCYALLSDHDQALRYGIAYVTSMQVFMVIIFYPVASHYGSLEKVSLPRLMADAFLTTRAMPLYNAVIGFLLNLAGSRYPSEWVDGYHVMQVLFFLGAAGSYFGIGLRLRLGDMAGVWKKHVACGLVHFLLMPAWTVFMLWAMPYLGVHPSGLVHDVMVIEAFTPTAINIVIAANLFHLDPRLASVVWLVNTLAFCVAVLPPMLWWWR